MFYTDISTRKVVYFSLLSFVKLYVMKNQFFSSKQFGVGIEIGRKYPTTHFKISYIFNKK